MEQQSEEWFQERCGRLTASRFQIFMEGSVQAKNTELRRIWLERTTNEPTKGVSTPPMEWGKRNEPRAIARYSLKYDVEIKRVGFLKHRQYNFIGCSPDFLLSRDGGGEVKCPYNESVHLSYLHHGMPFDYKWQVHGVMWVCELAWMDFISYDPRRLPPDDLMVQRIHREDDDIDRLEKGLLDFWDRVMSMSLYQEQEQAMSEGIPELF